MREREVLLIREIPPDLPPVLADRQRLGQVLLNLARNAITYTPAGGIVSLTLAQPDTGHLVFMVADTGIGIPSEVGVRLRAVLSHGCFAGAHDGRVRAGPGHRA